LVTVHGLKLEIGNWEEQYKSMKAKFLISNFNVQLTTTNLVYPVILSDSFSKG